MSDCIFCKIVEGQIPSQKVYEDERVFAFRDISPQAPVHILIIPKKHIPSLNEFEGDDFTLFSDIHRVGQHLAQQEGIAQSGYRMINNCGKDAGQVVFHLHYHLIGGHNLGPMVAQG
jgi:histidine triad (HIT) family protein